MINFFSFPIVSRFNAVFSKRYFFVSGSISLLLVALSFFLIWWQLFPEILNQVFVPLHYNIHFGVDLFGHWWNIFFIPSFGAGLLAVNTIISLALWKKEPVLSYFFMGLALISEIILFAALIFVIFLNLSYYG